jgi:multidrug efflux pump subunit AcrB
VVSQCQWPLFGATAIAVIAFAAIGLSEDKTGEYCNSLFWVIFISLAISWVAAITFTPLLAHGDDDHG